ncbi:MAG: hypothetical protein ABSC20_12425 [Candidatus Bathyarchaeia archaeon]|jgi:hypothetical protein
MIESIDNRINIAQAEQWIATAKEIDKAIEENPHSAKAQEKLPAPRVVIDVWDAILGDSWENICIHGKPRTGKTTVQMDIAFAVYGDWDAVLQSFIYNLSQILYHMDHGVPCRIWTRNLLHNRVPLIMPDDFGAGFNKAVTQHTSAMDIFKGMIDTLATSFGVFLSSMGTANSITQQLTDKYTGEIFVPTKGLAKYDKCDWEQSFRSWAPRTKKKWQDSFTFDMVPMDVYKEYDENRLLLVEELKQMMKDCMVDNESAKIIKRSEPIDIEFLDLIQIRGPLDKNWIHLKHPELLEVLKKSKSRSLVTPAKKPGTSSAYCYDLTDLGFETLKIIMQTRTPEQQAEKVKALKEKYGDVKID